MTEADIQAAAAGHRARNVALRDLLLQKGVEPSVQRTIDLHFWAHGQAAAMTLVYALAAGGMAANVMAPAASLDDEGMWNVDVSFAAAPDHVMSDRFTESLVRLAAECAAVFDGWGTVV